MLKICRIVRPKEIGVTNPHIVECDDGKSYIAKFPGNPDGTRVLINEYVCAELAKLFQLPVPNYRLVTIDNIEEYSSQLNGINLLNGTVFCSEELEKSTQIPNYSILPYTTNSIDALKTLIFDVIVGNNDRNPGNMLLNLKNRSFVIIDHSHVFVHGAVWDEYNLADLIGKEIAVDNLNKKTFNTLISSNNVSSNRVLINEYKKVVKAIKEADIELILKGIPIDWIVSEKEKEVLKNFILDRVNRVDEIYRLLNIGGD